MSLGFLIADAFAQTADVAVNATPATAGTPAAAPPGNIQEALMRFLPWFAILAVFYFLLIRPQNQKFEEHKKRVEALRRGDRVTTVGGVIGVISKIEGDEMVLEMEDGAKIRFLKSSLSQVNVKSEPVEAPKTDAK